ncbi:MAG: amino acid ABC transporter ATP-binding protein [Pyramidobacter sp.]
MIRIRNLHKQFEGLKVLRGVDLSVNEGEVAAIIGPSGTGKSTFLRCINYLERPERGTITIGDVTVDAATAAPDDIKRLRRQSAMVFQNYNLFKNMKVIDNVMEPLLYVQRLPKKEALAEAMEFLRRVRLSDKADEYPSKLSGGQQQRVGIARAMAVKPRIMLFDEPTAALDPGLVNEVMDVIQDLARQHRTMIVVTHEMRFAREIADKVAFMSEGTVVEQGTPAQIFERPRDERTKEFLKLAVH